MLTRRRFLRTTAMAGAGLLLPWKKLIRRAYAQIPGGTLAPGDVDKFTLPLIKPPAMPRTRTLRAGRSTVDYYEIGVRQFQQRILSPPHAMTTVWSYGSVQNTGTFNYPAFTIEAGYGTPVRVKWINDLVDSKGRFLQHILPVDQTLHWANPPGPRDMRGDDPTRYQGPVPMVTHVHGAHTTQDFDGYPEAWFLPNASNIPAGFARTGTYYDIFKGSSSLGSRWSPGTAVFQYPNDQRATTLWYHDHSLGMTRLNVYAGPAGFYLIRGGPDGQVGGILPGPAPGVGDDPFGEYLEIPIVIQDRSFNTDGSLFYPDNRAFFEGLNVPFRDPPQFPDAGLLDIPFIPDTACGGPSDVPPIWQPEFFGNMMVVNGRTWPYLDVERRRYRFRLLNGCNARFLILDFNDIPGVEVWQIGAEGGFLPQAVNLSDVNGNRLLMGPAERADVIVDFTGVSEGSYILANVGPDEPFGGGMPDEDFDRADPDSTGQVMELRVKAASSLDDTTYPAQLELPTIDGLESPDNFRPVGLFEDESKTVFVSEEDGNIVLTCEGGERFGPTAALLGTAAGSKLWSDPVTEDPVAGTTEIWEITNMTADAHPIHVHLVQFRVLGRDGRQAEPWETGFKDTVIAYPGETTRIQAKFDIPGLYVWHCHIVEHEDNEMMRPYRVLGGTGV